MAAKNAKKILERGFHSGYELLERAGMRGRSMADFSLKLRENLKKLQIEFTLAGFGLSLLGWHEAYQSSARFVRVEHVVEGIQFGLEGICSEYGELKSTVLTSFDQLQSASDRIRRNMVVLESAVVVANAHRESEYKQMLALHKAMVDSADGRYNRPDTIIKKKFG